jgi:DNA-binding HxlR family transcriptional regulator
MLTQTLRNLERDGLIARTVYPEVPPHVEYAMTPLSRSLVGLLEEMCLWAEEQYGRIAAARARYDEELATRQG